MAEELSKRDYLVNGSLKGNAFGEFEDFNLGDETVKELVRYGISAIVPKAIKFPFQAYSPPKKPESARPDRVIVLRNKKILTPVAVVEYKKPGKLKASADLLATAEQGLFAAAALTVRIAVVTDKDRFLYVDVVESLSQNKIVYFEETRDLNPAVIHDLLQGGSTERDPGPLAERVWQLIWHATKEEPKACLLTFIELFVLKFISDNLSAKDLPRAYSFYELNVDPSEFQKKYGTTAIEYYVSKIRPHIKTIFPDNTVCQDKSVADLFHLSSIVSKTSVINGFSFLKTSASTSIATFNRVFLEILEEFQKFGSLTKIDPEFKTRLYEIFLKKTARQQKLGQFFTPRNVVKSMIRMARLGELPEGSIVLDPACGVGGFVLEPLILEPALKDSISIVAGKPKRKLKLIGVDVDANTHILAKANLLIHLAELVRSPTTTMEAINTLMAETFVLMNQNETLGSLLNPPTNSVNVILTNPPYVTQGSAIYKKEVAEATTVIGEKTLRAYYNGTGLGVESLFLRYISGALKPGGRAFVIVPQGLLTRTDPGSKTIVLEECNLLASIALPRNTFFNTPQKTYILVLEKRHTRNDPRPPIFCAIARSIGESLDARRVPDPKNNDLDVIAGLFIEFFKEKERGDFRNSYSAIVKVVDPNSFSANDRWDSARFWSQDELELLGMIEPAVDRPDFIDEVTTQIDAIKNELLANKSSLKELSEVPVERMPVSKYFDVRRGRRVRRKDCDENEGDIPVYSGSKDPTRPLGHISKKWLTDNKIPIESPERPIITVNANGYVGAVFVRREQCVIHDDVMVLEPKGNREDIDLDYVAIQLQSAIAAGNFEYEAKLYSRTGNLEIALPKGEGDLFNIEAQRKIASAIKQFDSLRTRLEDLGIYAKNSRIKEADN